MFDTLTSGVEIALLRTIRLKRSSSMMTSFWHGNRMLHKDSPISIS